MENYLCPWETPTLLLFSDSVPTLLYYSHGIAILTAIIAAVVVLMHARNLRTYLFTAMTLSFAFWVFTDIIQWASPHSETVLFYWSVSIIFEFIIFFLAYYLIYVFVKKRDLPFVNKIVSSILILPALILMPTSVILPGMQIGEDYCDALEPSGGLYYEYLVEIGFLLAIVFTIFSTLSVIKNKAQRKQIILFGLGIVVFLISFVSGNLVGSITGNWDLAQFGLFGMPIFIGIITFLMVKFKLFKVKLIGSQALVYAFWLLILSLLFLKDFSVVRIVVIITLILSIIFGVLLMRSVKQVEIQRSKLVEMNKQQITLIHFVTHQVKGFLTKSRNVFSTLLDGDFGKLPEEAEPLVQRAKNSDEEAVKMVQEILNASNLSKGTVEFVKVSFDIVSLVDEIIKSQKNDFEAKSLGVNFDKPISEVMVNGDKEQLQHVIRNLIDNAIKYTPEGSITITISKTLQDVKVCVKDSGIGFSKEDSQRFFTEGGRGKYASKINVSSTGYGLFIAKKIMHAHDGHISANSEGQDKGSTFCLSMPILK